MKVKFDKTITKTAYAKINLFLEVGAKRDDGYHDITTVMHTVSLFDKISLTVTQGDGISVTVEGDDTLSDENNIAYRAIKNYLQKVNFTCHVDVKTEKNIPVSAGLGGGSCDAGAVLLALNEAFYDKLSKEEIEILAKNLGADVPFATRGGCVLARGIGEDMKDITPLPSCFILIIKDGLKKSTKEVYSTLDLLENRTQVGEKRFLDALQSSDLSLISRKLYNAFDKVVPIPDFIKESLSSSGALGYTLCGAGPSVIAIFDKKEDAEKAKEIFDKKDIFAFISEPICNKY